MNREPLDKNWRDRLDQHGSPIDTDQFWATLEPQLPKPEKKRRFGFLWLPLILGLLSATGLFIYDIRQKENELLIQSHSIYEKVLPIEITTTEHSTTNNTELTKDQINISESTTPTPAENKNKSAKEVNTNWVTTETASFSSKNNGTLLKKQITDYPSPPIAESNFNAETTQNNMAITSQDNAKGVYADQEKSVIPSFSNQTTDKDIHSIINTTQSIATLSAKPILVENILHLLQFSPPLLQRKKTKRLPWSATVQAGPGYTDFRYTDIKSELKTFAETRQATEQSLESWTAALHGRWTSKSGLFLEAGVSYNRMNSRLDWTQKETTHEWGLAHGFILEENGQMTPWQDSSWVTYNTIREVRHYNQITLLDLPVGIGYGWTNNKWRLDAGAGLIFNLMQSTDGRSINIDGQPALWGSTPELTYRKRLGLSYYAQTRLSWTPENTWGLFIQPLVQFRPTNHMDNNSGLKKTSMSMFMQFGYSYSF